MSKIFIIDDEPQIINSIETNLNNSIYKFYSFNNADEALTQIPKINPDLILLDLIMPKMNGFEFLQKLQNGNIDTKVIIVSGENKIDSAVKAMKLGAVDFITKLLYILSSTQ